jgi:hypothetical protein
MKFALIALFAISFTACSNTLYNHRKDFSPKKGKGPWTDAYRNAEDGHYPDQDPERRPLFPKRERQ